MPNKKPFVNVACICEKVLRETDGVLSAIRIVDTFYVQLPIQGKPAVVQATALVSLKSGDLKGASVVKLMMLPPDGTKKELKEATPILLEGGEQGANVIVVMTLVLPLLGLYQIEVCWNDEVLTTIPFRLAQAPQPAAI